MSTMLVFKQTNDAKMVLKDNGDFYVKKERKTSASEAHGGLSFKADSKTTASVSIKEDSDAPFNHKPNDGIFVADAAVGTSASIPSGSQPKLIFKKGGVNKMQFSYDTGENGEVKITGSNFVEKFGTRQDAAKITAVERDNYIDAVVDINTNSNLKYADGVSFWFKQDQIHQTTHVHSGPAFLTWHRELVNRYERLLRQSDPTVSVHYWKWTTDPRVAPSGGVALFTSTYWGSSSSRAGDPLGSIDNNNVDAGSREVTGNPADPPKLVDRNLATGTPSIDSDATIVTTGDSDPQVEQYNKFRVNLESNHNDVHALYIRGTIGQTHSSFEDPFVFLLHSEVDRLFASWQNKGLTDTTKEYRLVPADVYGDESTDQDITEDLKPWDGTVSFLSPIRPWTAPENEHLLSENQRNSLDASVVSPTLYDVYA